MKSTIVCSSFALALAFAALSVVAQEKSTPPTTAPTTAPSTQAAAPSNEKCPVSGDKVDPKVETVAYKGKTIGFCCSDCVEPFKKNPEKYAKNIK